MNKENKFEMGCFSNQEDLTEFLEEKGFSVRWDRGQYTGEDFLYTDAPESCVWERCLYSPGSPTSLANVWFVKESRKGLFTIYNGEVFTDWLSVRKEEWVFNEWTQVIPEKTLEDLKLQARTGRYNGFLLKKEWDFHY